MILVCAVTIAQTSISLLPKPQLYKDTGKNFTMGKVKLSTPVLRPEWEVFIMNAGGEIVEHSSSVIEVELVPSIEEARLNGAEAYRLSVSNKRIKIEAVTEQGVYWAMQTLRQLERKKGKRSSVAGCEIVDWPAFRIRGFMQDVGRSYISMEELKREIEILSRFKINVFHWHLTENQAWRLESKIFPMLNDSVNTIRMPGKYYTLEEARDLVDFCKKHQVLLIPEIDMPGHSAAFVRAFRHDMQSPEGMKILKLLLDEVCETFDVPYLHIGTDEVEFTNPHFVPEMVAYVRSKGKKVISWNPGWHYKPGEIDMTHLWSYRGKAQPGIPAIDSKFHYLNHFDVFGDIVALYNSRIYDQAEGSEDIAGTILALWHDRLIDNEWNLVIENGLYPNMLAIAERASGKSVAINAMIMSILMRATPDEVRFIMIDPKRVEFTPYNGIPHLYVPVVTENKEAASALSWGVAEMERRLKVMSKAGVRNISQYNKKVESGQLDDEEKPEDEWPKKMPYIVIIIDELADLMMNVGKEVELSISRIAQLARAAGIHMIVATQRPSTNVVTGLIKANITNRIAFNVASGIDSRVILDTPGAENLIGLGDMLFSKPEWPKPQRLQGCFVSEEEIEAVVSHLKAQGEPEYHSEILQTNVISLGSSMPDGSGGSSSADDPLLWDAADIVVASGLGSTSNIQRKLSVGYSRAGRIMDMLEEKGVVGPPNGSKPRDVLVDEMELESLKAFEARDAAEDGF